DMQIRPRNMVLAVGASPIVPAVPGLEQINYFTPDTILGNSRKLTHLLVVGGGSSALGLAQAFARLGSAVTLVPQGTLLSGCDPELVSILARSLAAEGLRILDGARLSEIIPRGQGIGAVANLADGQQAVLDVSHVLLAAGNGADLDALDVAAARLRPSE